MNEQTFTWWSPSLGCDTRIKQYGEGGTPVLAFPGNEGTATDWENHGLIKALDFQLSNGLNQVFCVESVDHEALFNTGREGYQRIIRQRQYENYLLDEVLPFIFTQARHQFLIAAGIHMGACHALNLICKYPDRVGKAICMHGLFDLKELLNGHYDDNVYYNNPVDYLSNLEDAEQLERLKQKDIRLVTSPHDRYGEHSLRLSHILWRNAVGHILDKWRDTDLREWNLWAAMLQRHIP